MRALLRSLPIWTTVSAIVAATGLIVAQSTDDNAPPYDERLLSTVAWTSFLVASLMFMLVCLAAALLARRARLHSR